MRRDEVLAMLDWPGVQDFFRRNGPMHIVIEVKKTRSSTYLRWNIHDHEKNTKKKKKSRS